jgi:hypothetical protein
VSARVAFEEDWPEWYESLAVGASAQAAELIDLGKHSLSGFVEGDAAEVVKNGRPGRNGPCHRTVGGDHATALDIDTQFDAGFVAPAQ